MHVPFRPGMIFSAQLFRYDNYWIHEKPDFSSKFSSILGPFLETFLSLRREHFLNRSHQMMSGSMITWRSNEHTSDACQHKITQKNTTEVQNTWKYRSLKRFDSDELKFLVLSTLTQWHIFHYLIYFALFIVLEWYAWFIRLLYLRLSRKYNK